MAQNELLAKNYAEKGEFEKAASIYKKLHEQNLNRLDYLLSLVEMNQQLERFDEAQKLLEDRLKGQIKLPQLIIELGQNYTLQNQDSIASTYYKEALGFIDENPRYAYTIGQSFQKYSLLDEAIIAYENAMELDPEANYNLQLGRIYGEKGLLEKMFSIYIDLIERTPSSRNLAQRNFSLYITEDPSNEANIILRKTLLKKIQENPIVLYNQILSWLYVQQKDYKKAFAQEKAIFKRSQEQDIAGIVDLAYIVIADKAYDDAREIMNFVKENVDTPRQQIEAAQFLQKIEIETATEEDYQEIEKNYNALITTFGDGEATYLIQIDYNHFLAFVVDNKDLAIENLKALATKNLSNFQEARVKMELADILVVNETFNRALIYYSQIEKDIKSSSLAQEARFKIARTSYYKGDFEWAQLQLNILKNSASQLIANDALQLSLIIVDNSLEDSTQTALKKYARADLLALQNKNQEAIILLEDILNNHKGESIEDEALLLQGSLFEKTNNSTKAVAAYEKLIHFFGEDILADDAIYRLGKLYEEALNQPEKAKELYEKLIFEHQDSIFFIDARNRYRKLRGDAIE